MNIEKQVYQLHNLGFKTVEQFLIYFDSGLLNNIVHLKQDWTNQYYVCVYWLCCTGTQIVCLFSMESTVRAEGK